MIPEKLLSSSFLIYEREEHCLVNKIIWSNKTTYVEAPVSLYSIKVQKINRNFIELEDIQVTKSYRYTKLYIK